MSWRILLEVRLPRFLGRLIGRRRSADSEAERYAAAEDVEQRTQAHYRAVTGVDATGRATPSKRRRSRGSKK